MPYTRTFCGFDSWLFPFPGLLLWGPGVLGFWHCKYDLRRFSVLFLSCRNPTKYRSMINLSINAYVSNNQSINRSINPSIYLPIYQSISINCYDVFKPRLKTLNCLPYNCPFVHTSEDKNLLRTATSVYLQLTPFIFCFSKMLTQFDLRFTLHLFFSFQTISRSRY